MKFDFSRVIKNVEGQDHIEDGKKIDFKFVSIQSLYKPDTNLSPVDSLACHKLALKIDNNTSIELTLDEVVLLRKRIEVAFSSAPLFYGQLYSLIEEFSCEKPCPVTHEEK